MPRLDCQKPVTIEMIPVEQIRLRNDYGYVTQILCSSLVLEELAIPSGHGCLGKRTFKQISEAHGMMTTALSLVAQIQRNAAVGRKHDPDFKHIVPMPKDARKT